MPAGKRRLMVGAVFVVLVLLAVVVWRQRVRSIREQVESADTGYSASHVQETFNSSEEHDDPAVSSTYRNLQPVIEGENSDLDDALAKQNPCPACSVNYDQNGSQVPNEEGLIYIEGFGWTKSDEIDPDTYG